MIKSRKKTNIMTSRTSQINDIQRNNKDKTYNISYQQNQKHITIQQIFQSISLYIKSAQQLKSNLQLGLGVKNYSKQSYQQFNTAAFSFESIITKLSMFKISCQNKLIQIEQGLKRLSQAKLYDFADSQFKVLNYFKDKYNKLIKQVYRFLNAQFITNQDLSSQDIKKIKENRRKKIIQIQRIENQMDKYWNGQAKQIMCFTKQKEKPKSFKIDLQVQNTKQLQSFQVLGIISRLDLTQMAQQELNKQFLAIRISASNLYSRFTKHDHQQSKQNLKLVRQEQDVLMKQLQQQIEKSKELQQFYFRLQREISEIKMVDQLIKKRADVRESIRMNSQGENY